MNLQLFPETTQSQLPSADNCDDGLLAEAGWQNPFLMGASAKPLVFLPEFRPGLFQATTHKDVRMLLTLLVAEKCDISVMTRNPATRKDSLRLFA